SPAGGRRDRTRSRRFTWAASIPWSGACWRRWGSASSLASSPESMPNRLGSTSRRLDALAQSDAREMAMNKLILTADRLFDGTGVATRHRPVLRIVDERIAEVT